MKFCPICHREYEDETMRFCLDDGCLLTSDLNNSSSRPGPEPTLSLNQQGAEPEPTIRSALPTRPTMTVPGFIPVGGQIAGSASRGGGLKHNPLWWVVLTLIIGGSAIAIALIVTRDRRQNSATQANVATSTSTPTPVPPGAQSLPATVEAAKSRIAGEWLLRREAQSRGKVVTTMRIMGNGTAIVVSGRGWTGQGSFDGERGYYDWRFKDGKAGRTTIRLDADGKLHGEVRGSGIDWDYQALRR